MPLITPLECTEPHAHNKRDSSLFIPGVCAVTASRVPVDVRHSELALCFCCRLSWVLMYAGFISVVSVFMTLVIKLFQMIVLTGFMVVVTLFTLYGLSLVSWQNMHFSSYFKSPIYKPVSVFLQGIGSLELLILYSGFCMLLRKFLFT